MFGNKKKVKKSIKVTEEEHKINPEIEAIIIRSGLESLKYGTLLQLQNRYGITSLDILALKEKFDRLVKQNK